MATQTGTRRTYDSTVGVKLDMEDAIHLISPFDVPFLGTYGAQGGSAFASESTSSKKVEWLEDELVPASDAVNMGSNINNSATTLVVDNGAYFKVGDLIRVDDEVMAAPETFSLKGNYPNPFNPSTKIMFTLGMENDVTVSVYSILGEEIATLQSGRMIPGTHSVRWNGLTSNGYNVASGVYFYQVDVAGQVKTGKMMLLK